MTPRPGTLLDTSMAWWPAGRLLRAPLGPRLAIVATWGALTAASIALAVLEARQNWSGLPIRVGEVTLGFSVYPPVAIAALIAFWIGPGFGAATAYASTLASGIAGGLDPWRAALFALGTPAEVYLLWFLALTLRVRPNLPQVSDWVRFLVASMIAATASSVDIMLYNEAHRLPIEDGQRLWVGWILGDIAMLAFVVAPILCLWWPQAHRFTHDRMQTFPRHDLTPVETVFMLSLVWATLAGLAFLGLRLLVRALDIPDDAVTASGDLLAPRLQEMGVFLGVFVGVLLLSTMALTAALAVAGERHLERSLRDELTGAFNRRAFQRLFRREVERSESLDRPVSLLYFDIDRFKRINDVYGHLQGDAVIAEIARQTQALLRPQDLLFRWGGEEFLILLSHTTADEAREVGEQLRAHVERNVSVRASGGREPVTVSVGLATGRPPKATPDDSYASAQIELIRQADAALYRAKEAGRNRVEEAGSPVA